MLREGEVLEVPEFDEIYAPDQVSNLTSPSLGWSHCCVCTGRRRGRTRGRERGRSSTAMRTVSVEARGRGEMKR